MIYDKQNSAALELKCEISTPIGCHAIPVSPEDPPLGTLHRTRVKGKILGQAGMVESLELVIILLF